MSDAYGYVPRYVVVGDPRRPDAVLPLMDVRSCLTGRRGVSLPFSDFCDAMATTPEAAGEAWAAARELGTAQKWRWIEVRSGTFPATSDVASSAAYVVHEMNPAKAEAALWDQLNGSFRTAVRKAKAEGVNVSLSSEPDAVRRFYRLHCLTRRRHGLPPPPYAFFARLQEHVLARGGGAVVIGEAGRRDIAAAVFLWFGGHALFKYGASDARFQELRGSNLVMWEGICECRRRNMQRLSLGRTDPQNAGLRRFKSGCGADESMLHYRQFSFAEHAFVGPSCNHAAKFVGIMTRMPLRALELAGRMLYRHMG